MLTNLLWKDARQVFPSVAICLGMTVLVQVLFISRWLRNEDFYDSMDIPRTLAMMGPLLVALACAGMIFGNERQSRTMHWMSTLPIRWHQSLVSQMLVAMACILVTAITTHWIAGFGPRVVRLPEWQFLQQGSLSLAILFAAELFIFSVMSALVFEETLYGLGAAAIACISMNFLIGYIILESLGYGGWPSIPSDCDAIYYPALAVATIVLFLGSVWMYRWRWTLGQYVDCWNSMRQTLRGRWRSEAEALAESISRPFRGMPVSYPNRPFWTLFIQSLFQAPFFRLALVTLPWAFALLMDPKKFQMLALGFSILSSALLGLSCFVLDHAKCRMRFLADRGVSAWQFYWARTLPLFGIVILMITGAWLNTHWFPLPRDEPVGWLYLAAIGFFFAGQLASLCFRNVLIAICMAATTLFISLSIPSLFNQARESMWQYGLYSFDTIDVIIVDWIIASIAAYLLFAVFWLIPSWIRSERPGRRLAGGFVVSGLVVPLVLLHVIAVAGYWMLPKPLWLSEQLSLAEIEASQPKQHVALLV